MKYFKKYKILFFLALSFLTLEAFSDLLQPRLMARLVDEGIGKNDLDLIISLGITMFVVTLIGLIAALIRNVLASYVSQKFAHDLRVDVYRKVHALTYSEINEVGQGSLVTRLTNDITQIQTFTFGMMRVFVKAPILCVGAMIMMFSISPKLALITLVFIPLSFLLIYLSMKIGFPLFLKVQKSLDRVNSVMREYLSGVRVVKAFNRFSHEEQRFKEASDDLSNTTMKTMRVLAIFSPSIALMINLGIVLILYLGGYQTESIEIGKIMAFVMYMTQILHAISIMTNIFNMFVRAKASNQRVKEVLEFKGVLNEAQSSLESIENYEIEFRGVEFTYPNTFVPALKGIDFRVKEGEWVGIIGSTGAGKTTIINLLLRFYDVSKGEIRIGTKLIQEYSIEELRKKMALVGQKNVLFTGTILDNIRYRDRDANINEVKKASSIACCDEFINSFTDGYQGQIGQGGVNVSGGQKQRLCIARALLAKPQILLLYDATSAVDATTEYKLRTGIKEAMNQTICFVVSQKISSIIHCDQIIVLEEGEMIGIGSHEELLMKNKLYQEICYSQYGGEIDE